MKMASEPIVSEIKVTESKTSITTSLLAGATAGLIVDVSLFPLDTVKTRLQSEVGFWKSGGFSGIYKGIGPTAIGSAPCAAAFFAAYNYTKELHRKTFPEIQPAVGHTLCASFAEVIACLLKVPMEVVKQRRQAILGAGDAVSIVRTTLQREGFIGMYRGFLSTILRDIPFSAIEFPIWEALKTQWKLSTGREVNGWEGAFCGAVAGGVAGAITTPLDVAKTRIILADSGLPGTKPPGLIETLNEIYRTKGVPGLFAGFAPRVILIFLGGGVFFGVYEVTARLFEDFSKKKLQNTNTKLNPL